MKVLFVCYANVGRSQAAMEFYNQLVPGHGASAGTVVDSPGEKLKDRYGGALIITVMKEFGSDMSENQRTQVTKEMLDKYEKIIVMAEPDSIPPWLSESPKFVFWKIADASGKSIEETRKIASEIKSKVEHLVKTLNQ